MTKFDKRQRVLFKVFSSHPTNPQPRDRFGHELTGRITALPTSERPFYRVKEETSGKAYLVDEDRIKLVLPKDRSVGALEAWLEEHS